MEEVVEEEADKPGEDEDGLNIPDETVPSEAQKMAKIANAVNVKLLPNLLQYLESRDATTEDTTRIPIAVGTVKSGKDVLAEGFKTRLREVKSSSSKGLDSFSITARHISLSRVSVLLLLPLCSIMQEIDTTKIMQLVDGVLKSVANGLNSGCHITSADLLSLCHTKKAKNHVIVQTKRQEAAETDHYANSSFRFVVSGLALLHTALRRSRFDFREADIISRLQSMVVAVGNILYPVLHQLRQRTEGIADYVPEVISTTLNAFIFSKKNVVVRIMNDQAKGGYINPFVKGLFSGKAIAMQNVKPIRAPPMRRLGGCIAGEFRAALETLFETLNEAQACHVFYINLNDSQLPNQLEGRSVKGQTNFVRGTLQSRNVAECGTLRQRQDSALVPSLTHMPYHSPSLDAVEGDDPWAASYGDASNASSFIRVGHHVGEYDETVRCAATTTVAE
ncbi:U3 snoRNP protein [Marasmius sp. AFHP31]|nr:U3 snoRNP protein [Marasmius sp. AFHP31]